MGGIRIGVNALYLIPGGVGGTEIYLRSLLVALAEIDPKNGYFIFTNQETGPDLVPPAANFHHLPQPVRGASRPARILFEQLRLPAALRRESIQVLLNAGFTTPARSPCPAVTVFHDCQHKRHPEYFRWFDLPVWNLLLGQAARTADAIIAVSQATADDVARFYPAAEGRTRVVHHGVDEEFRRIAVHREQSESEPFLLCVSTLHPHKNIERLLRAYTRFHREAPGYTLVLAGMRGFHTATIESLIGELGLEGAVRITGWIPREELYDLYRRAHAFVYPSTFEGFGMPVLEALAAGLPTACSAIPPLLEVAGEAALFFDPGDDDALFEAIRKITLDGPLRTRLIASGRERAAHFSWRRAAEQTLKVLRSLSTPRGGD